MESYPKSQGVCQKIYLKVIPFNHKLTCVLLMFSMQSPVFVCEDMTYMVLRSPRSTSIIL